MEVPAQAFCGQHCETVTAGTLLGTLGEQVSEAMLFGLGRGLSFFCVEDTLMPMPMLAGRIAPGLIAQHIAQAYQLSMRELEGREGAWRALEKELENGKLVAVQLDCYHLEYFRSKVHFAGHFVAVTGFDEEHVFLVDTSSQGGAQKTSRASFMRAWGEPKGSLARPWYGFVYEGVPILLEHTPLEAFRETFNDFSKYAVPALLHVAERFPHWLEDCLPNDALRCAKLMERGGTGGANFRNLFAGFLDEAQLGDIDLRKCWRDIATQWHDLAQALSVFDQSTACALMQSIVKAEVLAVESFTVSQ